MSAITDLISGVDAGLGDTAVKLRVAITGKDPAADAALATLALNLEAQAKEAEKDLLLAQMEINKIEAASTSGFKSNWRPAIGWTGAISLAMMYWPKAVITMVIWTLACIKAGGLTPFPDLGLTDLVGILGPMLGIAGMRTAEKFKGVATG